MFHPLILVTIVIVSTATEAVGNPQNGHLPLAGHSRGCSAALPAGLPRFVMDPPTTFYPIGDSDSEDRLLIEIVGSGVHATLSAFLKLGCPRRETIFKNETDSYYHLTAFGDQSSLLYCHYPNPSVEELICSSLDGNRNKDYSESITLTDMDTFKVFVRCYPTLRMYTWIVQSNVPTLSGDAIREIRQHVTGLGFNWNKAKPIRYDRCSACRTTN